MARRSAQRGSAVEPVALRQTVRDRLMEAGQQFSKSELKVVRMLLSNYPAAGLTTVSKLAKLAGVSDPTVLRLAVRLGYEGFADMQSALIGEVEAHMRSPLTMAGDSADMPVPRQAPSAFEAFLSETLAQCDALMKETPTADYERAVSLLTDPKFRIICHGGRFSRFVAGILQRCLHHLRDGTSLLDHNAADLVDELAGIGRRHVLAVFDYRRYQADVVRFAEQAHVRGARIVLFTDSWRSPISAFSDVTLTAPTATASPFDTLVTPLIQVEAVVAGAARQLDPEWRDRAAVLEQVRNENKVTLAGVDIAAKQRLRGARRNSKGK